jgi:hypothetical protein
VADSGNPAKPTALEACDCGSAQENHGWACRCDSPPSRRSLPVLDCSTLGHTVHGVGTATGLDAVVWNERCERCGELVKVPS